MKTKHWLLALFAWMFYNKSKKNDEDRARQQKHQDKISAEAKRQADTQRPW
jgi:hypothetical protein